MPETPFIAPDSYDAGEFVIRRFEPGDGPAFWEAVNASLDQLRKWLRWQIAFTAESSESNCRRFAGNYLLGEDFVLGIWKDGLLLGCTGFHLRHGPISSRNIEVSMWIRTSESGKGLGTRALRAMLDWGFGEWGFNRIVWKCDTRNVASARVAETCGLVREATYRADGPNPDGSRRDSHLYAIVRGTTQHGQDAPSAPEPPFIAPDRYDAGDFVIRRYEPGDGPALARAMRESYEHLRPWMIWARPDQTDEEAEASCRRFVAKYLLGEDYVLGVWIGDRLVGGTGFHLRQGPFSSGNIEVGMWIHAEEAGKGLGTRVLRALVEWGIRDWGFKRIVWRCDSRNVASAKVAENCGFILEGTLRSDLLGVDGTRRDTLVYAIVKSSG